MSLTLTLPIGDPAQLPSPMSSTCRGARRRDLAGRRAAPSVAAAVAGAHPGPGGGRPPDQPQPPSSASSTCSATRAETAENGARGAREAGRAGASPLVITDCHYARDGRLRPRPRSSGADEAGRRLARMPGDRLYRQRAPGESDVLLRRRDGRLSAPSPSRWRRSPARSTGGSRCPRQSGRPTARPAAGRRARPASPSSSGPLARPDRRRPDHGAGHPARVQDEPTTRTWRRAHGRPGAEGPGRRRARLPPDQGSQPHGGSASALAAVCASHRAGGLTGGSAGGGHRRGSLATGDQPAQRVH